MTPADTAKHEAARQAVILVAGVVGMLAMLPFYRKLMRAQAELRDPFRDPVMAQVEELEQAQAQAAAAAARWDRTASWLFTFGPQRAFWWAHDRAEQARRAARS